MRVSVLSVLVAATLLLTHVNAECSCSCDEEPSRVSSTRSRTTAAQQATRASSVVVRPAITSSTKTTTKATPTSTASSKSTTTITSKTLTSSSSSSTSAAAQPTSAISKKRGLAVPWNSVGSDIDAAGKTGYFTWMYNWECYSPPGGKSYLQFMAMLRTGSQDDLDRMNNNLQWSGAKTLMCLNEPDIADQANLSVAQGVKIWKEVCWPKKQQLGLRLGAPAISNGPNGIAWLQQFMAQVGGSYPPDFAPIHWYGVSSTDFQNHVTAVHQAVPTLPIWVTEFANQQNDVAQQETFMRAVLKWMDSTSWVEKYSWFAYGRSASINDASRLLTSTGAWTNLAYVYATA